MQNISREECKEFKISHALTLKLATCERFTKMPQMIPWVGENYGVYYKKLLLIGESHYLSYESKIQLDAEKWYSSSVEDLDETEIAMTFTRKILSRNSKNSIWGNTANKFKKVYPEITQIGENIFVNFAFYNYFQRPAEEQGKSINVQARDKEEANRTFLQVIDVLAPDIIIFTSSKAWQWCRKKENSSIKSDFVPHPGSRWWNRSSAAYGNQSGSEKFENLIKAIKKEAVNE